MIWMESTEGAADHVTFELAGFGAWGKAHSQTEMNQRLLVETDAPQHFRFPTFTAKSAVKMGHRVAVLISSVSG